MKGPPGWGGWWGGPDRIPYQLPMQHQPIIAAQLPARAAVPGVARGEWRTRGWVFHWGALPLEVVGPVSDSPDEGPNVHVEEDPARIRRCENVNCVPIVGLQSFPLAWELARCTWPAYAVPGLYRLGTYLQAQPLDADGGPVGPPFITGDNTPLCVPVTHPELLETLDFVWSIRTEDQQTPPVVVAAPTNRIPPTRGVDGLPWNWSDFRYSWQSRYSDQQRSILSGRMIRLFVQLRANNPDRWQVTAGGIIHMWWQTVNAWDPSIARTTVRTK